MLNVTDTYLNIKSQVITIDSFKEMLAEDPSVLHVSAHGIQRKMNGVQNDVLILENSQNAFPSDLSEKDVAETMK